MGQWQDPWRSKHKAIRTMGANLIEKTPARPTYPTCRTACFYFVDVSWIGLCAGLFDLENACSRCGKRPLGPVVFRDGIPGKARKSREEPGICARGS